MWQCDKDNGGVKGMGKILGIWGNNEWSSWAKVKNVQLAKEEAVKEKKITSGQIQGDQVEKLEFYSVNILYLCYRTIRLSME